MGTGAESLGLLCLLGVDLFPAYSDDSPLCELLFDHNTGVLEGVLFLYLSLQTQRLYGCTYLEYSFFPVGGQSWTVWAGHCSYCGVFVDVLVPSLSSSSADNACVLGNWNMSQFYYCMVAYCSDHDGQIFC
jgi:hypothetical protein